jgi:hypothetical protein
MDAQEYTAHITVAPDGQFRVRVDGLEVGGDALAVAMALRAAAEALEAPETPPARPGVLLH